MKIKSPFVSKNKLLRRAALVAFFPLMLVWNVLMALTTSLVLFGTLLFVDQRMLVLAMFDLWRTTDADAQTRLVDLGPLNGGQE